ncbi:hypothetical protein DFH09DRAFT_1068554 [Mycena vulgaris]|nr:hypothetical protein DFH09DRAFT_1068554 [Mycena vulgaris]
MFFLSPGPQSQHNATLHLPPHDHKKSPFENTELHLPDNFHQCTLPQSRNTAFNGSWILVVSAGGPRQLSTGEGVCNAQPDLPEAVMTHPGHLNVVGHYIDISGATNIRLKCGGESRFSDAKPKLNLEMRPIRSIQVQMIFKTHSTSLMQVWTRMHAAEWPRHSAAAPSKKPESQSPGFSKPSQAKGMASDGLWLEGGQAKSHGSEPGLYRTNFNPAACACLTKIVQVNSSLVSPKNLNTVVTCLVQSPAAVIVLFNNSARFKLQHAMDTPHV